MKELPGLPEARSIRKEGHALLPEHSEGRFSVNESLAIQVAYKPPTISRCGLSELIADCFSMISLTFSIVFRRMYPCPNTFNEIIGPNMAMGSNY
jgi:hypothetical protein